MFGFLDNGFSQGMLRSFFERTGQNQKFIRRDRGFRIHEHIGNFRATPGQGSCFIKQDGIDFLDLFQGFASLD